MMCAIKICAIGICALKTCAFRKGAILWCVLSGCALSWHASFSRYVLSGSKPFYDVYYRIKSLFLIFVIGKMLFLLCAFYRDMCIGNFIKFRLLLVVSAMALCANGTLPSIYRNLWTWLVCRQKCCHFNFISTFNKITFNFSYPTSLTYMQKLIHLIQTFLPVKWNALFISLLTPWHI